MRRFAVYVLLVTLCAVAPMTLFAQPNTASQSRTYRNANKKQQKAQKKYAKAQRKAQRKMLKTERKNTRYPSRQF
jgi:preprotein translocase subunit Sec63